MTGEALRLEGIHKAFGGFVALQSVDLSIQAGELVCFVGPSGCGKTTLLRIIAGLESQTRGRVIQNGRDISTAPPSARDYGIVFQSYALFPNLTISDNIAYGLVNRRRARAQIGARVKELLTLVGLPDSGPKYPSQLSGGQQQRIALARALATAPSLLLLDEPLSNLDAKLRVQTRAEITRLHNRLGTTFIYVTHDQVEAMTMADRIAVLRDGLLQQLDTPQNLYDHPSNVFVAGFIGSPSMNFFDATLTGTRDEMYVDTGSFRVRLPQEIASRVGEWIGKELVFGIRPENIHHVQFVPPGTPTETVKATVDVTELMGNEIFLYLDSGGKQFIARVDPRARVHSGEQIEVAFDMSNVKLFNPKDESALYS